MLKPWLHLSLLTAALAAGGCTVSPYHHGRYDGRGEYHGAGYEAEYSGGYRRGTVENVQAVYDEHDQHSGHLPDYYRIQVKLGGGGSDTNTWLYDPGLSPNDPVEIRDGYTYLLDAGDSRS